MVQFIRRAFTNEDLENILDLLIAYRLATTVRTYLTVWRTRLLLSSRVRDLKNDATVWLNHSRTIIAFAFLWSRHPDDGNLVTEYYVHPRHCTRELVEDILKWGARRANEVATDEIRDVTLYSGEHLLRSKPQADFLSLGFSRLVASPVRRSIYLVRPLGDKIPDPSLPPGYSIMTVGKESGVKQYEEIYDFTDVQADYREYLLASDEYNHLVVLNPEGTFVAYCEYSICRREWEGKGDRVGWIDYVGTRQVERGKGIGTAILLDALSRLKGLGAEDAMLVTITDNLPALRIYKKAGFIPVREGFTDRYRLEAHP